MSSKAKKAANRANAQKSTGPRTERGKAKSKFNAVTHGIYAATPVFPWEDEAAYRELEKSTFDYYSPVGLPEIMLVREMTREAWRLDRLTRAEIAVHKRFRDAPIVRFLRQLSDDEMVYVKSRYGDVLDDQIMQRREEIEDEIRGEPHVGILEEYQEPEENGEMPEDDVKCDVDARLNRVLKRDEWVLAGLVPKAGVAPQGRLTEERRETIQAYFRYEAKLRQLQEARTTLPLIAGQVPGNDAAAKASAHSVISPDRPANQNRPDTDIQESAESTNGAGPLPSRKGPGGSPTG